MITELMKLQERVAVAMWRSECGDMPRVASRRTLESFRDQAPELKKRWLSFASAAILEITHGTS